MILFFEGCHGQNDKKGINLSVSEFEQCIANQNAYVLDVRTKEEAFSGRIKNAKVLDIHGAEFMEYYRFLPKDKTIYVYCRSGIRSRKAVEFLKGQGFNSVYHLEGGINAWESEHKKIK